MPADLEWRNPFTRLCNDQSTALGNRKRNLRDDTISDRGTLAKGGEEDHGLKEGMVRCGPMTTLHLQDLYLIMDTHLTLL